MPEMKPGMSDEERKAVRAARKAEQEARDKRAQEHAKAHPVSAEDAELGRRTTEWINRKLKP
jgi:hypothetical protein